MWYIKTTGIQLFCHISRGLTCVVNTNRSILNIDQFGQSIGPVDINYVRVEPVGTDPHIRELDSISLDR